MKGCVKKPLKQVGGNVKIPASVREKYKTFDPELDLFLDNFDVPAGSKILEIGAHDNPVSIMLAECGYVVHGIDLREYDQGQHENYTHYVMNFTKIPTRFIKEHAGSFDAIISISALEHFGLGTYTDKIYNPYADVYAAANIYNLLRPEGNFIVTVPFGGRYVEVRPHWKVYDMAEAYFRFGLNMQLNKFKVKCVEDCKLLGCEFKAGDPVDMMASTFALYGKPSLSAYFDFWKVP